MPNKIEPELLENFDNEYRPLDSEILELAGADGILFSKIFFPQTVRQENADFHPTIWEFFDNPIYQYFALECFRGSSKTTIARIATAKRIAYRLTRTCFYTSISQAHAIKSLRWLKRQIEFNKLYSQTFHLSKGDKWTDEEINIRIAPPGEEPYYITIVAVGITGQIRGVNVEDYRPDFIIADDPCDEENTNTQEGRQKISNLFFGGLMPSLAPRSENFFSQMCLLQTCLAPGDLIDLCHKNTLWKTIKIPCFNSKGQSVWPKRFTTKELLALKNSFIENGQINVWLREYECKLVNDASAAFKFDSLCYWEELPERGFRRISIDPASSDSKEASDTAIVVLQYDGPNVYVCEYWKGRGANPEQVSSEFFRMCLKWKPRLAAVESIAYQRILAWFLRNKMAEYNYYIPVKEVQDKRKKWDRIRQAMTARIYNGQFFVHHSMTSLIEDIKIAPNVTKPDLLDAIALNIDSGSNRGAGIGSGQDSNVIPFERAVEMDRRKYGSMVIGE